MPQAKRHAFIVEVTDTSGQCGGKAVQYWIDRALNQLEDWPCELVNLSVKSKRRVDAANKRHKT